MSIFSTSDQTPRVLGKHLDQYMGKKVRLVGHVMGPENDNVALVSPDGMRITVVAQPSSQYQSKVIEVIGIVKSKNLIEEVEFSNFGDSFAKVTIIMTNGIVFWNRREYAEMETYTKMCELADGEYRALFL